MPGRDIVQTAPEFARLTQTWQQRAQADPELRGVLEAICGGPAGLQAFLNPAGLSITPFAQRVEVPASTVRHYQRLGLVTPYRVSGKFRFWLHNLVQVEAVKQWRALGLSLADIQAQGRAHRLGGQSATFNTLNVGPLSVLVTAKSVSIGVIGQPPLNASLTVPDRAEALLGKQDWLALHPSPDSPARLLAEVTAARKRLEEQLRALERRVEQARNLEAALRTAQDGRDPAP